MKRALALCALVAAFIAFVLGATRWNRGHQLPGTVPVLSLHLDTGRAIDLVPGTPVRFHVVLTAFREGAPIAIGRPSRPWTSMVRLVEDGGGHPFPWGELQTEGPLQTIYGVGHGDVKVLGDTAATATVDNHHIHHLTLSTSPESMRRAAPGTHRVRAVIAADWWPPWAPRAQLESPPVEIVVHAAEPTAAHGQLETARLVASAGFFLDARRYEDARRTADELGARDPKNAAAWLFRGDALMGLGRPAEALHAYRAALALAPRSYEAPTGVYERMQAALRKLH